MKNVSKNVAKIRMADAVYHPPSGREAQHRLCIAHLPEVEQQVACSSFKAEVGPASKGTDSYAGNHPNMVARMGFEVGSRQNHSEPEDFDLPQSHGRSGSSFEARLIGGDLLGHVTQIKIEAGPDTLSYDATSEVQRLYGCLRVRLLSEVENSVVIAAPQGVIDRGSVHPWIASLGLDPYWVTEMKAKPLIHIQFRTEADENYGRLVFERHHVPMLVWPPALDVRDIAPHARRKYRLRVSKRSA
jgi:hypothetical protein